MNATIPAALIAMSLALASCNRSGTTSTEDKPAAAVAAPVPIAAKDCRTIIDVKPAGPWEFREGGSNAMPASITVKNNGAATWGGATDMRLAVVWFEASKKDSNHAPNLGEQWWALPAPLGPGESLKLDVTVTVPKTAGQYSAWFSMLQPGVMWCYHTGDPATKVAVTVQR